MYGPRLSQVEMTGSSIFEYIHQQDHAELAEQLGLGLAQGQSLASPGSAGSEEGTPTGTNNPDGTCLGGGGEVVQSGTQEARAAHRRHSSGVSVIHLVNNAKSFVFII